MIKIFITNLGKYNEGELLGEWVDLPCDDLSAVYDAIKVCHDDVVYTDSCGNPYEEVFITDYESTIGIEISEYQNIEELNDFAESLEDIDDNIIKALLYFGVDWADIPSESENIYIYSNCSSMADVAYEVVNESGLLDKIPENLQCYFDYDAYGRDLAIEGNFYYNNGDYYEYIG